MLPIAGTAYEEFLSAIKHRIHSAQVRAATAVNRELVTLYWEIGREILERQQREGWGTRVIERLAADLREAFPGQTGFSTRNLKYMQKFARAWPDPSIVQQVVAQLPWGHHTVLLDRVGDAAERAWYMQRAAREGWSRNLLLLQVKSGLAQRQGRALTNFDRTLPPGDSDLVKELLKSPYTFDFLTLDAAVREQDLERALVHHIRDFLLELGVGFAFLGRQYALRVGGREFFLDLLFYHVRLRRYVVLDLKVGGFEPEYAGKMNFYLAALDDLLRGEDDGPSIGIILCTDRNEVIVEYALRDVRRPIGVSTFATRAQLPDGLREALPSVEVLTAEVEAVVRAPSSG